MEKLITRYNKNLRDELKGVMGLKNSLQVPTIEKVVISVGIGDFKEDDKTISKISDEISKITGLKAKINHSKKAVSAFKLRIGQPIGLTVTLRGDKMYDFIDRLVNIALPRVRDFRGLPLKAFDGRGNYCIGIKEYSIFPEIKYEDISQNFGFQVNIKTSAKNDENGRKLLESLGFPFEKKENKNG